MDCKTGKIHYGTAEEIREKEREIGRLLVPLSDEQASELEPLGARRRKGRMRNKPCPCGSGKKFKRCCWSKYA